MISLTPLIALIVTCVLMIVLLRSRAAARIQDIPNERSLHHVPVPRVGGVALVSGILAAWLVLYSAVPWWLVLPLLLLILLSIIDDLRGLPVSIRFSVHALAAILFVTGLGLFAQSWWLAAGVVLGMVWMTNLYNFMDGSDGLAGGMALFGFGAYGVAAWLAHYEPFAMLNFSVAAATLGFLWFNFHPAKVFMGDAGSIPLGFLAAALGTWGWWINAWPFWFPVFVFSPFVVDATVTLTKRTVRGEKIWQAHREHYYQHAIQLGAGHRNTALFEYALMAGAGMSGVLLLSQPQWMFSILLGWSIGYAAIMLRIDQKWKRRNV